ncbi:MAG: hypothetical protein H6Q71_1717 [Firmicutes bacterium]|nr:hypothetical protein [Bacillota bacterium]
MKKFQYTLHKELWNWLADNPDKEKYQWPKFIGNGGDISIPSHYCFACCYAKHCYDIYFDCPLKFKMYKNDCLGGMYYYYEEAVGEKRSIYARLIANLPVKEGIDYI